LNTGKPTRRAKKQLTEHTDDNASEPNGGLE